jgi:hypothetical protein
MPVEQKEVVFYDDEIIAVQVEDGTVYVPLRPICELLGIQWSAQRRRINRDEILSEVTRILSVSVTDTLRTREREMLCLPLDFVNGFLFGINAQRVNPEVKPKLLRYQRECYQVLADAFIRVPDSSELFDENAKSMAALQQIRENALAVARLAEEQMRMQMQVMTRLDKAAIIVGQYGKRITALEQKLAPREAISDEQAADVSAKVMAIATEMSALDPSKNHYQSIFGELHRRFRVTSYKNIRQSQYQNVLDFLDTYSGTA